MFKKMEIIGRYLVPLLILTLVSFPGFGLAKAQFPDTKDHWAEAAIMFLYEEGVVEGLPSGNFGVNLNITRGDAAIMIARAKKLNLESSQQSPFKDVVTDHYYFKEVLAASKAGYINGYPDQTFKPKDKLTREEMAKILVESYDLKNNGGAVFRDAKVNSWSFPYIQTLVSNRITNGYPDKTFRPKNTITRAEFALLLARAIDERFRDSNFKLEKSFNSIEEEAKYVLETYSPNRYAILQEVAHNDRKSVERIISQWKNQNNLFQTIETAVHEEVHGFQSLGGHQFDNAKRKWLLNDAHLLNNEKYIVSHYEDAVFPSEEVEIPTNLRTFRWETYIGPGSNVTANLYGPYGLLDELEAYYHGNKAVYDSYEYLLTIPYNSTDWFNYYTSLGGSAFYEFKFFTLSYLLYAKENHPDVYHMIMKDSRFKNVFQDVYLKYEDYVEVLKPARQKEMIKDLEKMGVEAKFENHFLYIGHKGRGNSMENISAIKEEMTKPKYQSMLKELLK